MDEKIRELLMTPEFEDYYNEQSENVKEKFKYVMHIMTSLRVVSTKFIKTLENTEFYEMRVSIGSNEHRSIIFTMDASNFMDSKRVILLNAFLKKNTKQYRSEIQKARRILSKLEE